MNSRDIRLQKKVNIYTANNNIDTLIERLKKIRALNGDTSLFGADNYVVKKMRFNKLNMFTRC